MWKKWFAAGSVLAGLSVALGAFGAHGLKNALADLSNREDLLRSYETAARYQMYHAFAILAAALLMKVCGESKLIKISCWFFIAGILLFSGSLYFLSTRDLTGLTNASWLGPITPFGGLCFIAGWITLAIAALRKHH
jgi:uncharacterized membrane protein YgdD (TMEM256/DUF423 family)